MDIRLPWMPKEYSLEEFSELVLRRGRRELRGMPEIKYFDDGTDIAKVGCWILKDMRNVAIVESMEKANLFPGCLDDYVSRKLKGVLYAENDNFPLIFPSTVLHEEIVILNRELKLGGKPTEHDSYLDDLERKTPGTKFGLLNSFSKLEDLQDSERSA
ncbi:MAG: hypothetical protein ABIA93_00425 [Candidatus Woesearchaeota archaeon]